MKPENRKQIYDWLASQGFEMTPERHQELKALLQAALPPQLVYKEDDYILEEGKEDEGEE